MLSGFRTVILKPRREQSMPLTFQAQNDFTQNTIPVQTSDHRWILKHISKISPWFILCIFFPPRKLLRAFPKPGSASREERAGIPAQEAPSTWEREGPQGWVHGAVSG